jgi:hypothetical protein
MAGMVAVAAAEQEGVEGMGVVVILTSTLTPSVFLSTPVVAVVVVVVAVVVEEEVVGVVVECCPHEEVVATVAMVAIR